MQVSPDDHTTAPITFGRAQAIHSNVVGAIAGAVAAATGAHGHRAEVDDLSTSSLMKPRTMP